LRVFGVLFRIYSYLYHLILALFLLGIATVAIVSHLQAHPHEGGGNNLNLGMLPWKGHTLVHWLLGAGVFGLLSLVLAWMGKLRFLFLLYSLAIFGMMFRGYFLSSYSFSGKDEFRMAIWLTVGALIAIVGAWSQFRRSQAKRRTPRA
jgi:hypothetical protein